MGCEVYINISWFSDVIRRSPSTSEFVIKNMAKRAFVPEFVDTIGEGCAMFQLYDCIIQNIHGEGPAKVWEICAFMVLLHNAQKWASRQFAVCCLPVSEGPRILLNAFQKSL